MWGFGGGHYWGRKGSGGGRNEGIVVVFAWMSSQERHLRSYVQLYDSLGWNSLVCHSQFLNLFFPERATPLAVEVLNELVRELKIRTCPVVLASFSGGPKACMYRVLQILEGQCEVQLNHDDIHLVKDSISGFIYDSSPVDFTSDLGSRFVVHPTVIKMSHPPRFASCVAKGIASGLDALFLSRFESQRAEYWQTLYSSINLRAPYLVLCSENDDLAPYQTISNFVERLRDLGGDVKLVTWNGSPHVGHYCCYPVDYKAAVTELLGKAAAIYSQRGQRPEGERMDIEGKHDEISEPIFTLRRATASSSQSSQGFALTLSNQMFLPSSVECYDGRNGGSVQDEGKEGMVHLPSLPSINAHGVLGQILFDVCVPKNVEDWDIRQSDSYYKHPLTSSRRHTTFNPIKCIRRSRL